MTDIIISAIGISPWVVTIVMLSWLTVEIGILKRPMVATAQNLVVRMAVLIFVLSFIHKALNSLFGLLCFLEIIQRPQSYFFTYHSFGCI
jgi:hypothetical protein